MSSRLRISIALVCLQGLLPAAAESSDQAVKLVSVMRLDFAVLDSLQWNVRRNAIQASTSMNAYECMMKQDPSRFTPSIAERISANLSAEEVRAALTFYLSPVGKKFTEASLADAHNKFDPSVKEAYPQFSQDELTAMSSFLRTKEGRKLRQLFALLPAATQRLAEQMLQECSRPSEQ